MNRCFQLICLCYGLLLFHSPLFAREEILDFHSQLRVDEQGQLWVRETLHVQAEGLAIQRGIYREFPTEYKDPYGNKYRVGFDFISAQRDGQAEMYKIKQASNGVVIYLGDPNRRLRPGVYEYQIEYRTDRQLGHFSDYDELYWNVTGNGWGFPILAASGELQLPETLPLERSDLRLAIYTGTFGSNENAGDLSYQGNNRVTFSSQRVLQPGEGLTIAVGFPVGLVPRPSGWDKLVYLLRDNAALLWAVLAVVIVTSYYLRAWWLVGRDPKKGTIIPEYEPPAKLSPAACAYVLNMSMGFSAMTAALVSCAIKRRLEITQQSDKVFRLQRGNDDKDVQGDLSAGEYQVLTALVRPGDSLVLENSEHTRMRSAYRKLEKYLEKEYESKLFFKNTRYWWRGFFIVLASVLGQLVFQPSALQFFGLVAIFVVQLVLFYFLLRAPTVPGRRVMDRLEGFKQYLNTAEADRLEAMRGPELTPEVFEQFLPYAFALGVANSWCQGFENWLSQARLKGQNVDYTPNWYHGSSLGANGLSHLSQNLATGFTHAISSASTPPGSSSGSGGGGFSGGGGGGGGGGGW